MDLMQRLMRLNLELQDMGTYLKLRDLVETMDQRRSHDPHAELLMIEMENALGKMERLISIAKREL